MSKKYRTWSKQLKLEILDYYKSHGLGLSVRKYEVSQTSIYKWRDKYEAAGPEGLSSKQKTVLNETDIELERLRRENRELKNIVADKELELRVKNELLKKSR